VALNRAVALAERDGPAAGLEALHAVEGLDGYHAYQAARADLLRRAGRPEEAAAAYRRAVELSANPAERAYLAGRLAELTAAQG
jgi:RNA polymerase sigma-70 factor (ECF subfamily)